MGIKNYLLRHLDYHTYASKTDHLWKLMVFKRNKFTRTKMKNKEEREE